MNIRKEVRKSLLEEQASNSTTIYYCCDGSNLMACNSGGPYFEQWLGEDNVIELDMYDPPSGQNPMNIIYSAAFPQEPGWDESANSGYGPWTTIQDYIDWCTNPINNNSQGQVGAWCDVVVDSVTRYPKGCGGTGVDTFGDPVSLKQPETRKGDLGRKKKGRAKEESPASRYFKWPWQKKKRNEGDLDRKKKGRAKEQTTSGAAGAYSQPIFGEPMKRKINEKENRIRIKESEFIKLIEKSIYAAKHGGVIKEALTDADEKRIGVLARKELKDYESKLEKKIDQMLKKALKGKDFEDHTLKITRNALIQLYKALWIRRSFWTDYIKNTPS